MLGTLLVTIIYIKFFKVKIVDEHVGFQAILFQKFEIQTYHGSLYPHLALATSMISNSHTFFVGKTQASDKILVNAYKIHHTYHAALRIF